MLYDVLEEYRAYLKTNQHTSDETARTYYNRLAVLLKGQSIADPARNLDIDKVIDKLATVKYKSYYSQYKNAFLYFCAFKDIRISGSDMERIRELQKNTQKKYRKMNPVEYKKVQNRLAHMRNKKLKLSYQTIIATGLRVSELAQLTPQNSTVNGNEIEFRFIAKGRNNDQVTVTKKDNPELYQALIQQIANTEQDRKLFYSTTYLQIKAKELGFKCHDLRRICAKLEYKKTHSKNEVMKKLRHSSIKNTNIYLRSRVKL